MSENRIVLEDSIQSAAMKMAENNPGAVSVLAKLVNHYEKIDPTSALGGLGAVMHLDSYGFYGSNIWLLYADLCGKNLSHMVVMIRAMQMGFVGEAAVHEAISSRQKAREFDLEAMIEKVQEALPDFRVFDSDEGLVA